jgi:hypothetical protein
MIKDLVWELERAVPELRGAVFPASAPKFHGERYLVYVVTGEIRKRYMDFESDPLGLTMEFGAFARSYDEVKRLETLVVGFLRSLRFAEIGETKGTRINHASVVNAGEVFEPGLMMNRAVIEFDLYGQKKAES